jgi:hypothetical protein
LGLSDQVGGREVANPEPRAKRARSQGFSERVRCSDLHNMDIGAKKRGSGDTSGRTRQGGSMTLASTNLSQKQRPSSTRAALLARAQFCISATIVCVRVPLEELGLLQHLTTGSESDSSSKSGSVDNVVLHRFRRRVLHSPSFESKTGRLTTSIHREVK